MFFLIALVLTNQSNKDELFPDDKNDTTTACPSGAKLGQPSLDGKTQRVPYPEPFPAGPSRTFKKDSVARVKNTKQSETLPLHSMAFICPSTVMLRQERAEGRFQSKFKQHT